MAVLLSDPFTGSNGAAWSTTNWALGRNPSSGGGATIQNNEGRLATGTLGGYSGDDKISRRANIADRVDAEILVTVRFDASECYPSLVLRSAGDTVLDTKSGYHLFLDKAGTLTLTRNVNYASTQLGQKAVSLVAGTYYRARFRVVGSSIQARVWPVANAEPTAWDFSVTDTGITAAGAAGLIVSGGNAASSSFFFFDNFEYVDGASGRVVSGVAPLAATTTATARRIARATATTALAAAPSAIARTLRRAAATVGVALTTREARPTRVTATTGLGLGSVAAVRQARPAGPVHTGLGLGTPADTRKAARPTSTTALPLGTSASTAKRARPAAVTALAAVADAAARYLRPVRERAAPAFPALAVRLVTPRRDLFITGDLLDLSFRSVVPGGFASCTAPLARPLTLDPDELAMFARLYVYDTRSGETVWEGYLEDPSRSAGNDGQVWDLTAIGPSGHTRDRASPYVLIDHDLTRYELVSTTAPSATHSVTDYSGPTAPGTPTLRLNFPQGMLVLPNSGSRINLRYMVLWYAGQRLARFGYRHIEGRSSTLFRTQGVTRVFGLNAAAIRNEPFSTAETPSNAFFVGTDFPFDNDALDIRMTWEGTTSGLTVSSEETWTEVAGLYVMAQRFNRNGSVVTSYPFGVFAHEVVTDLLVRFLPRFDPIDAVIEPGTHRMTQLAWLEAVTAQDVLDTLMELEPAFYWAAWESDESVGGRHNFAWRSWPTSVRYEADVSGGYSSRASAADLFNQVRVRYVEADGRVKSLVRTQPLPILDDAGMPRQHFMDLSDAAGGFDNAARAADTFLADHRTPVNAGSLTVTAPITDLSLNRLVDPWSIRPGELIRVRGISPRLDSLNATDRDGVSVFRIIAVDFSQGSQSATLELDAHPPGVARALADRRAAQGRKRA